MMRGSAIGTIAPEQPDNSNYGALATLGEEAKSSAGLSRPRARLAPEKRKRLILDAALTEFIERGYSATRLEHIAGRAGVTKALPIFYFGSKATIFREVIKRRVESYLPELSTLAAKTASTWEERFATMLSFIYDRVVKNPVDRSVFFLISTEGPQFPELVEIYYQDAIEPAIRAVEHLLDAGRREGAVRPDLSSHTTIALLSGALLASQWRRLFQECHPIDIDGFFKNHIDIVLRGILTP